MQYHISLEVDGLIERDIVDFLMKITYLDVYVDLRSGVGFGLLSTISVVG